VVLSVVLLLTTLLSRTGLARWPFELFANFPVQLAVAGAISLPVALLLRSRVAVVATVLALVINGTVIGGTLASTSRPARADTERLTIVHLNAQTGRVDIAALRQWIAVHSPAVAVVLDPASSDVASFRPAGTRHTKRSDSSNPRRL
jgi:hypothetical protein